MTDIWVLYSIFPNRAEAVSAARTLVENNAIACANIYEQVSSVYRWQGTLYEEAEVALIAKTSGSKVQAAINQLKALHSYEVPCITAWAVSEGLPAYLQWVADETLG